jgi:hypothetical protein
MKKVYSKFLLTMLMLMVTSVFIFGQKKVLFLGRGAEDAIDTYMSDKDLHDSLVAWEFDVTYMWNDTYKSIGGELAISQVGADAIFINETCDSKIFNDFAQDLNYPIPCVTLEGYVVHQDRWGWLSDVSTELLQPGEGEATEDNTVLVILDNTHYITQPFTINQEVKWSNADENETDLGVTGTVVIKEVNYEYSGKLATVRANINDDEFYNLVTVDSSESIPNKVVLWGINANGLNGEGEGEQHYGTNEFFQILRRACEWAYDEMPQEVSIEDHIADSYKLVAFPNPATVRATIRFNVPVAGPAKVTFYDVTGQQVDVLLDKNVQVGNNFIFMDVADYPKGVYFIKLQFKERTEFTKLVIN